MDKFKGNVNSDSASNYKDKILRVKKQRYEGQQTENSNLKTMRNKEHAICEEAARCCTESKYLAKTRLGNYSLPGKTLQKEPNSINVTDKFNKHKSKGYEHDSEISDSIVSENNVRSQTSCTTVASKHSARELRKVVKSQCELHELIADTIKRMCITESEARVNWLPHRQMKAHRPYECSDMAVNPSQPSETTRNQQSKTMKISPKPTFTMSHCQSCSENHLPQDCYRDVSSDFSKVDKCETYSSDLFTIPVDDVINSKVVNPMIRKLQRMYMNNLREEMSLMEELDGLPQKVSDIYKSTILKRNG